MVNATYYEDKILSETDPYELDQDNQAAADDIEALTGGLHRDKTIPVLNCLPVDRDGKLDYRFQAYNQPPWYPIFYNHHDPYNDIVGVYWGPRGGGKTISGVSTSIIDGQMRGIPCISNIPFSWIAIDINNQPYRIESIPFDQERFAVGDRTMKYHRLLLDEGNYLADRMKATSNKNLAMTDILQQARKFRMCVSFCTINYMWLDGRITGSLVDILIECNDLHYKSFGRNKKIPKGQRICWDIVDQSGKMTGNPFTKMVSTTFNARLMWNTYNTENFVDPLEARKKLARHNNNHKTIIDEFGREVSQVDWLGLMHRRVEDLAKSKPIWDTADFFQTLGIYEAKAKVVLGTYMSQNMGVTKRRGSFNKTIYDLSEVI